MDECVVEEEEEESLLSLLIISSWSYFKIFYCSSVYSIIKIHNVSDSQVTHHEKMFHSESRQVKSSQFYLYSAISQQMLSHDTLQIEQV